MNLSRTLVAIIGLLLVTTAGRAADLPPDAVRLQAVHGAKLQSSVRGWVSEHAKKLRQASSASLSDASLRAEARTRFAGQSATAQDIETMVALVLAEAARGAEEDLKAVQAQVKASNDAKQKLRELQEKVRKQVADHAGRPGTDRCVSPMCGGLDLAGTVRAPQTIAELRAIPDALKGKLDSVNELSETTSLRLQMMMDRRSKLVGTLSNVMKKISTTQDTLVQNLK